MDVKELQQVDDDGLEQLKPVLEAGFPLTAADVQTVLAGSSRPRFASSASACGTT
jgi:hypothetical protein